MASKETTNGDLPSAFTWDKSSTIPLWINGSPLTTPKTFPVTTPLSINNSLPNTFLYNCSAVTPHDAIDAVKSAQDAFPAWRKTKVAERREIFYRAAEGFRGRKEECWEAFHMETGGGRGVFEFMFHLMMETLKDVTGKIAEAIEGSAPQVEEENQHAIVFREPFGVCLAIGPWNGPYPLGLRACLFPIACGNTVVLKGPEVSPMPYWIIADVLHKAGLPAGVLNMVYHAPEDAVDITNLLIERPEVKKINFTGSSAVGAKISEVAGRNLKPVVMELGGHNCSIVLEDANLSLAATQSALGSFIAHGQICLSTGKIIVQSSIVQKFRPVLVEAINNLFGIDGSSSREPLCLVSEVPVERNKKLFADALSKGASILTGDAEHKDIPVTYLRPTVIENITKDMQIYQTESFAPTVSLYVRDTIEEMIELANDTEYGLSCALFTEDLRKGLRLSREIETGAVHINSMSVHDEAALSFGGVKKSGWGRFNALEGLREWTFTKAVTWVD